jgi:general secretion pathway protein F
MFGQMPAAGAVLISLLCYFILIIAPVCLVAWAMAYLLSLPMRRQEHARFFLHLLESALEQGRPVEQTLVDIGNSNDRVLGKRFHLLAANIREGLRLGQALEKVPRFLPPQIMAMLRAGEELGDLRKVLPACQYLLKDAQSNVRGAASYLVVLAFVLSPFAILVLNLFAIVIFPKFNEIAVSMAVPSPAIFRFVQHNMGWLILGQAGLFAAIVLSAMIYIGGPRFVRWFQFRSVPFVDWIAWRVPWKQKRMQRNFSAMLAVLLDGGVTEVTALRLAGESAANEIFRRRAACMQDAIARGVKLTEASQSIDGGGELRWRLTNAVQAHGGFLRALTGWHEALDAKAFQQEQAAAHALTSALVVANGVLVALVALSVFGVLVSIIETGLLW